MLSTLSLLIPSGLSRRLTGPSQTNFISKVNWHAGHQDPLVDILEHLHDPSRGDKFNPMLWLPCWSEANNLGDTLPPFHFPALPPPHQGQPSACTRCYSRQHLSFSRRETTLERTAGFAIVRMREKRKTLPWFLCFHLTKACLSFRSHRYPT